ncbi:cdaS [Symbiodinium microadriaticum]|nr:cdaS [Symbiodinium microadriaticum]
MAFADAGSKKLLSFQNRRPVLAEEGLKLLRSIDGSVHCVAVVGEGRSGKSSLANLLLEEESFLTAATAAAVTEGIDVAVKGTMAVMDCEGSSNAKAPSRPEVLVMGGALARTLLFVVSGILREDALSMLARTVAEMQLLSLTSQQMQLVVVVNMCTVEYTPEAFEEILSQSSADAAAQQSREAIARAFPREQRHFLSIPFDKSKNSQDWKQSVEALKEIVGTSGQRMEGFAGGILADLAEQLVAELERNGRCELPSLHHQVLQRHIEGLSEAALLELKTRLGPSPDNYDPDLTVDIAEPLASFQDALMRLKLPGDLMDKAVQKAHETMWKIAEQRSADNMALGDDTRDWEQVLWRGCRLLASRYVGARIVVERRINLDPFLRDSRALRVDPPIALSVRWLWEHFNETLNPDSHDYAIFLRNGHVVAKRVPAPALPSGVSVPRGNSRHRAAVSMSLRSDAWVAVISQERGEVSVACAGELWPAGGPFPRWMMWKHMLLIRGRGKRHWGDCSYSGRAGRSKWTQKAVSTA